MGLDFEKAEFMSGSLNLNSGNGLSIGLLALALSVGAFDAGLIRVVFCTGVMETEFVFGLTKCLSLVSVSMRSSLAAAASLSPCAACRGVT